MAGLDETVDESCELFPQINGILELQPDDVLVVFVPGRVSTQAVERLKEIASNTFGGRRVAVLDSGASIGVMRHVDFIGPVAGDPKRIEEGGE